MSTFIDGGSRPCMEYHDKDTNVLSIYVGSNMLVCMCLIPKIICSCTIISSTHDTSASCSSAIMVASVMIRESLVDMHWL